MKKYKIKIEYETEICANNTEEAVDTFLDRQDYLYHDLGTFIDENMTVEEIEVDELQEIVKEKIEKIGGG